MPKSKLVVQGLWWFIFVEHINPKIFPFLNSNKFSITNWKILAQNLLCDSIIKKNWRNGLDQIEKWFLSWRESNFILMVKVKVLFDFDNYRLEDLFGHKIMKICWVDMKIQWSLLTLTEALPQSLSHIYLITLLQTYSRHIWECNDKH